MNKSLSNFFDVKSMIFNEKEHDKIINLLLKDRTTRNNIIWATDGYKGRGNGFYPHQEIQKEHLDKNIIIPRAQKVRAEQKERTKDKAEVMTPSFIIKQMVEAVDDELQELPLIQYVRQDWLEITAGEAPYIVNRIDTVSGEHIAINDRVGFLDKKLQRISKEIDDHDEWLWLAYRAYKASYGYEFQGDSLYLARLNLLHTFVDYYKDKFNEQPSNDYVIEVARIISYNLFQMDGLKYIVPLSDEVGELFPNDVLTESGLIEKEVKEPVKVITKNWSRNQLFTFKEITEKEGGKNIMKFDVVIGNPPYQEEAKGTSTKDSPVYHLFMEESQKLATKVCLITPARFLFNAGATPKRFNRRMLDDARFKVVKYFQSASKVFPRTQISGGVAVTYWDETTNNKPIGVFTQYEELKEIMQKVQEGTFISMSEKVHNRGLYRYSDLIYDEQSKYMESISDRRISTNAINKLPHLFHEVCPDDGYDYTLFYGLNKRQRVYRWFRSDYVKAVDNLHSYKVIIPKTGNGALGDTILPTIIGQSLVGEPGLAYTETFISAGDFETKYEATAVFKYFKSKFARILLGVLKVTQDVTTQKWRLVPLQDFTPKSDIDWSKSIPEIDQQLYKKYNLNEEEIEFIETHVKEME